MIVEGYCDVLTLHQAGLRHVVAPMASTVTPEQLGVLRPLTERVTLLFDGDEAGHKATLRAVTPLLESELHATVANLPADEDPDTFVRRHDSAALTALLTTALPIVPFVIKSLLRMKQRPQAIRAVMTLNRTTEDWHRGTQAATLRVVTSLNPTVRSFCAESNDNR